MSVFVPCATQKPQVPAGAHSSRSRQVEAVRLMNEELNETASTSSGATDTDIIDKEMKKEGSSKWMSKGKRKLRINSRSKSKSLKKLLRINQMVV